MAAPKDQFRRIHRFLLWFAVRVETPKSNSPQTVDANPKRISSSSCAAKIKSLERLKEVKWIPTWPGDSSASSWSLQIHFHSGASRKDQVSAVIKDGSFTSGKLLVASWRCLWRWSPLVSSNRIPPLHVSSGEKNRRPFRQPSTAAHSRTS